MDIPNLSSNQSPSTQTPSYFSLSTILICLVLAIATGFWASRLLPTSSADGKLILPGKEQAISTENITDTGDIAVDKIYGDTATIFKDSATGTIEKGSINGVGTHILNREGGISQRASLTSSVVELDLFVGRKVEVKGETNASKQTSWLLDVGSVKVLE